MDRSENMRRIRSKDMAPELLVRRLVYRLGFRYRLHGTRLPGRPDMVFTKRRKAIFIHGCFWHQHEDPSCKIVHLPKSNLGYWLPKLERNRERDLENQTKLKVLGWNFLTVWECQLKDQEKLAGQIKTFLDEGKENAY